MVSNQEALYQSEVKYKFVAPDGGWGHLITVSVTVMNFVTIAPAVAFGLLYGNFLESLGDETTGTAITNAVFNAVQSFTGLAANSLLQRYSYREVGLIGATLYLIGAITTIFITNLSHLIISFGVLQAALINNNGQKARSLCEEVLRTQIEPLLSKRLEKGTLAHSVNLNTAQVCPNYESIGPRFSVISLGDRSLVPFTNGIKKKAASSEERSPSHVDLSLLKDLKYLNISCGISFSYTADVAFFSIIPLVLNNVGFLTTDIALMMMVYFGSDLVSRILLSIVSALCKIKNRYVFLIGSFLSAVFRIAFVLNDTYLWKMITLGILGFLRCLVQTPMPLVISEEYRDNFPTAFSLYMVVCGFVSLIFGLLMSLVKSVTGNDVMVVHLLTVAYLLCSVSWTVELLWTKIRDRDTKR